MESHSKEEFIYTDTDSSNPGASEQLFYLNSGSSKSVRQEAKQETGPNHSGAGSSGGVNECPGCLTSFVTCEELQKHIIANIDALQPGALRCNLSYQHVFKTDQESQLSSPKPYKCFECSRSFKTRGEVRSHALIHTEDKPYKCVACVAQFKRKTELRRHELVHLNLFPYKCMECIKCFRTRGELKSHYLIHSNYRHFQCPECNLEFKRRAELNRHRTSHQTPFSTMCSECRGITDPNVLKMHLMSAHGVRLFKCRYCSAEFLRENDLKIHSSTHTSNTECSTCKGSISKSQQGSSFCSNCVKATGTIPKISATPSDPGLSGSIDFSEDREACLLTDSEEVDGSFACSDCDKLFKSKAQLSSHRITHSPVKAYRKNENELCVIRESTPDV